MKRMLFQSLGVLFSIVPPIVATLLYFPLWIDHGATQTVSGLCALLLILCAIPLFRFLKGKLGTPSLPMMWGVLFLLVRALGAIIGQVSVISFVGFVSNLIGSLFFRLSRRGEKV